MTTKSGGRKLTAKQERFVEEYLIDLNATQAARRAGYSEKTAYSIGQENLKKPEIEAALDAARQMVAERVEVDQDKVIAGLLKEAEFTGEGASHGARVSAWEKLGKHLGMFVDKHEHAGKDGGPFIVEVVNFAENSNTGK